MKELSFRNIVRLELVPTAEMEADLFTKPLPDATFIKHRDNVMNRTPTTIAGERVRAEGSQPAPASSQGGVAGKTD